jgi:GNAT superfamily N-acetyltransferase
VSNSGVLPSPTRSGSSRCGRGGQLLPGHPSLVDRAHAGQGLGAELLDWAGTRAADEGADWLRVDVWTTNEHLQHYYLRQGFTYVRTVVLPHNPSGALFQRPAQRVPTPHLEEVESLTG